MSSSSSSSSAAGAAESGQLNYEFFERKMDKRFRFYCRIVVCANLLIAAFDTALAFWIIKFQNTALDLFAIVCAIEVILYVIESVLLLRGSSSSFRGTVARMTVTLLPASQMPPLRRFALCTHSHALAQWHILVILHIVVVTFATLFGIIVYFSVTETDLVAALTAIGTRLLSVLRLYVLLSGFYRNAIYVSMRTVLKTANLMRIYATSRAKELVDRQLKKAQSGIGMENESLHFPRQRPPTAQQQQHNVFTPDIASSKAKQKKKKPQIDPAALEAHLDKTKHV